MNKKQTLDELHKTCNMACEILIHTDDGDLLEPDDLKLTEFAVNGHLNDTGFEKFEKLFQRVVVEKNYNKPYLHDIPHLTRDQEGYIYYKSIRVEHYDRDYVYSEAGKNELMEMKRRCEFLERKGILVSGSNVIWRWGEYEDEYGGEGLKELDALLGDKTKELEYSRVEIYNSGREYIYFICGKPKNLDEIRNHPVTNDMIGRYFDNEYDITVKSYIYGKGQKHNLIPLDEIKNRTEVESLLQSCHNYLRVHNKVEILPEIYHKTDFTKEYDTTKKPDDSLNNPDSSLQYSETMQECMVDDEESEDMEQ